MKWSNNGTIDLIIEMNKDLLDQKMDEHIKLIGVIYGGYKSVLQSQQIFRNHKVSVIHSKHFFIRYVAC